jgi:hypothetical protein
LYTGHYSYKRLCIDILNIIDRHTFKDNPFPCDPKYTGIQKRAEDTRKKFKPLTYNDIKDDPYYYIAPVIDADSGQDRDEPGRLK